jgi:hypothetical protein
VCASATVEVNRTSQDERLANFIGILKKVIHPPSAKHRVGYFFILSISNTTNVTSEIINIAVGMSIGFPSLLEAQPPTLLARLTLS